MMKCKVCGMEFEATLKRHYVARDGVMTGAIVAIASDEEKLYDAFDCPNCGCQNIAGERKRVYIDEGVLAEYVATLKPVCFGNFEEEQSEDCEDCEYAEGCAGEGCKARMKQQEPDCLGKYDEVGCSCECEFYTICMEKEQARKKPNKRRNAEK